MKPARQKIILIGSGGAGKSTLARTLGETLHLPVHHLDALFWRPGWVESSKDELRGKQEIICAQEKWIIDGNYSGTIDARLATADTVIFLDLPRTLCIFRAIKRSLLLHGRTRPDMAPDCPERVNREFFKFLKWIWDYPVRSRPGILAKLDRLRGQIEIIRLRSPRQVDVFLSLLRAERASQTAKQRRAHELQPLPALRCMHANRPFTAPSLCPVFALLLNGSINAGKTSVARELRALLPRLAHVEVDALGDFLPEIPLDEKFALNLANAAVVTRNLLDAGFPVVVTYPLSADEHRRLSQSLAPHRVHTITLSPPLEVARRNRGQRPLTAWEESRVTHHYVTGIATPAFGETIDNSHEAPAGTARRIISLFALTSADASLNVHPKTT